MSTKKRKFKSSKGITFEDVSLTEQSFKAECDIVAQIHRLSRGLDVNGFNYNNAEPLYGDFTEVPDFATYQNIVADVKTKFEALPSSIRERFNYNPTLMMDFLKNPDNKEEAIKLGLVVPKEVQDQVEDIKNVNKPVENGSSEQSSDGGAA